MSFSEGMAGDLVRNRIQGRDLTAIRTTIFFRAKDGTSAALSHFDLSPMPGGIFNLAFCELLDLFWMRFLQNSTNCISIA